MAEWFNTLWSVIAAWFVSLWDGIVKWALDFADDFYQNFIFADRWKMLLEGLGDTLIITFFALLLGIALGIVVAVVRSTFDKNGEDMRRRGSRGYGLLRFFNGICNIYLTVIRGTPMVVQLMIMYFVILVSVDNSTVVAILAFGINSGAYVAEIFRSGIMAVDKGQVEAGRSLGFNYLQTMWYIVIPQMFKVVLPTLCNEFIVLIKETSVAGYVGIMELTKAAEVIRGRTYSAFLPLLAIALIYLALTMVLTWLVGLLERRLRQSDH